MSHLLKIKLQFKHSFINIKLKWFWEPGKKSPPSPIWCAGPEGTAPCLWGLKEALDGKLGTNWAGFPGWHSQEILVPLSTNYREKQNRMSGLLWKFPQLGVSFGRFTRECAAGFLRDGQELGTNLCTGRAPLKNTEGNLGGLINNFCFHSLGKTSPPELNLHHSGSTGEV